MKQRNRDIIIFSISVVLNVLFLLVIPQFQNQDSQEKKVRVGLVTVKNRIDKVKKVKKTQAPPKVKTPSLTELSKLVSKRKTEITTHSQKNIVSKREIPNLEKNKNYENKKIFDEKQAIIKKEKPQLLNEIELANEIKITDESAEELVIKNLEEKEVINIVEDEKSTEGLPSGYKLEVSEIEVEARWDENNKEPVYPELAQLRGMQGKVLLKLKIDKNGKITSVFMEKGSGVPEINEAIEKIVRTWKIYLNKNGLFTDGEVTLEYNFKLQGNTN